jgi:diadenosine tetraphosphate (Ap4A) HIT family hydrolase
MSFELDSRLSRDSILIANIDKVQVRLSKDSRYPWLILVPEITGITELHDLSYEQQLCVLNVSNITSLLLKTCFSPDKLNVASLGNVVKQLHIHHVARFEIDDAWPGPIWGQGESVLYGEDELQARKTLLTDKLKTLLSDQKKLSVSNVILA